MLRTHPFAYLLSNDVIFELKYEAPGLHVKNQCLTSIAKFVPYDYGNFPDKSKCFKTGLYHLRTWKDGKAGTVTCFKTYSSVCARRLKNFLLARNEDVLHNMACSEPALATTSNVYCICAGVLLNISQIFDFNIFHSRMV